jgi:hypothetical protein
MAEGHTQYNIENGLHGFGVGPLCRCVSDLHAVNGCALCGREASAPEGIHIHKHGGWKATMREFCPAPTQMLIKDARKRKC